MTGVTCTETTNVLSWCVTIDRIATQGCSLVPRLERWAVRVRSVGVDARSTRVGQTIELRRLQRGLSRRLVAELVGRSEEWLRLVETGRRHLDSIRTIIRLSEVLGIEDFRELIELPSPPPLSAEPPPSSVGLTRQLVSAIVDGPVAVIATPSDPDPSRSVADLAAELRQCLHIWQSSPSRYSLLVEQLPPLLATAHHFYGDTASFDQLKLLVQIYHLARELLTDVGAHTAAWTCADRAMAMAMAMGRRRQPYIAECACHVATAWLHLNRPDECQRYAMSVCTRLDTPRWTRQRGALQLIAAQGAAAQANLPLAQRLLATAGQAAGETACERTAFGVVFDRNEVALTRMKIALDRANFTETIEIGAEIDPLPSTPVRQRTRYHTVLAQAFIGRNEDVAATFELTKASDACPEDLRYNADTNETVRTLTLRHHRLVRRDLDRLAAIAGLN
ncbi:helix-turn-helix domain-containing protein [Nocardia vulneris]|uniref:helix-turn-helix domain-containing protein n=1 Tax=Nocardia vulneris TaxID=1141657 RepID=UPI0009E5BEB8|nr:helix-turn-helix transcriptional regulator [Nocardia vulneris]